MPNLALVRKKNLSSFRRMALGTWRTAGDPSVYGSMRLRMDEALRYMEEFREKKGRKLTISHMMAKAVAMVLEAMPDANAILRLGQIYVRKDVAVFFQVSIEDSETGEIDLSGATVHDANEKSLVEIFDDFQATVDKVRSGKDKELEGARSLFKTIPFFLIRWVLNLISFLSYTLNLDLRWAGMPRDAFGSVMVTNIGSLGLESAYVPLVPYSRVPLLLALGVLRKEPVVIDDAVGIEQIMMVHATFDHRILDGSHAATMSKTLREWMEHPYEHFDALEE